MIKLGQYVKMHVQGLGDATTDENVEDDEIQQEEREFDTPDDSGGDVNIKELNDILKEDRRIITIGAFKVRSTSKRQTNAN